jgi:hypothetical protein
MDQWLTMGAELLVWAESNVSLAILMLCGLLMPGALICLLVQSERRPSQAAFQALETRLLRLSAAVELLTDTTESGFTSAFAEIERLGGAPTRVPSRGGLQARITRAAMDGQSVRQIARTEGISEGEVQLRLGLREEVPAPEPAPVQVDVPASAAAATVHGVARSA